MIKGLLRSSDLLVLLEGERFGGIALCQQSRLRLAELFARLEANGQLTAEALRRYVPPLLSAFSADWTSAKPELDRFLLALNSQPVEEDETDTFLRRIFRRVALPLAMAVLVIALTIGLAWISGYISGMPAQQRPVDTVVAILTGGEPPQAVPDETPLNPSEQALFDLAPSLPSAYEAASQRPELAWLITAVEDENIGWEPGLPMPLANREFVEALLAYDADGLIGVWQGRTADFGGVLVRRSQTSGLGKIANEITAICDFSNEGMDTLNSQFVIDRVLRFTAEEEPELSDEEVLFRAKAGILGTVADCEGQDLRSLVQDEDSLSRIIVTLSYGQGWSVSPWWHMPEWGTGAATQATPEPVLSYTLNWFLFAISCLAGLAVCAFFISRPRFLISDKALRDDSPSAGMHLVDRAPELLDERWAAPWLDALDQSPAVAAQTDLTASVRATAKAAGFLTLVDKRRRAAPTFIVAIERRSPSDAFTDWWSRVFLALRRFGADVRTVAYRSTQRLGDLSARASEELAKTTSAARAQVIVFADLVQDEFDQILAHATFRTARVSAASPRGRMRGVGPLRSPLKETDSALTDLSLLTGYTDRSPTTLEGLFGEDENWLDETAISEEKWDELRALLYLYLGTAGSRWLFACALFPQVSQSLAWHMHDLLHPVSKENSAILAGRLFTLPWLRAGFIPLHLRERFLRQLGEEDVARIQDDLLAGLSGGESEEAGTLGPQIGNLGQEAKKGSESKTEDAAGASGMQTRVTSSQVISFLPSDFDERVRSMVVPNITERLKDWRLPAAAFAAGAAGVTLLYLLPPINEEWVDPYLNIPNLAVLLSIVVIAFVMAWALRSSWLALRWAVSTYLARREDRRTRQPLDESFGAQTAYSAFERQTEERVEDARIVDTTRRRPLLAIARVRAFAVLLGFMAITSVLVIELVFRGFGASNFGNSSDFANIPVRGEIVDRNGVVLASNFPQYALWFYPNAVSDGEEPLTKPPEEVADALIEIFPDLDREQTIERLSRGRAGYLRRRISPEEANQVLTLGEIAIQVPREMDRLYPQGQLAAHIIGFTREDGEGGFDGLMGAENVFEERLTDPELRANPVALSIDARAQSALESELARAVSETRAAAGTGIILDVETGEVLAMANVPTFNPNTPVTTATDYTAQINRATNSIYEFGSVFKPITLAAAIDAGVVSDLGAQWDASPLNIAQRTFSDYSPDADRLNAVEALVYSSNTVTMRQADALGGARLRGVFEDLAMHERPYIELQARGMPLMPYVRSDGEWSRLNTMVAGYGYGVAPTPLHVASAYATLVNGGVWRPATIRKINGANEAPPGRRVFKAATSARMRQLLRFSNIYGTGRRADVAGYRVGGYTGTAEKFVDGRYSVSRLVSSYVGAFPMDRPRYVVFAMLDEPKITPAMAQRTAAFNAAPLVGNIIRQVGPMLGVTPDTARDVDVSDLRALIER